MHVGNYQSGPPRFKGRRGHRPRPRPDYARTPTPTRGIDRTKRGLIPSKTNPQGTRRSGAYKRKEQFQTPGSCERKALSQMTARYQNSRRGRARDALDTASGTQEPNSPIEVRLDVQLAPSAFLNPTAEV